MKTQSRHRETPAWPLPVPLGGAGAASPRRLRAVGALAAAAAAVTAAQGLSVALTGEELCVGQGCALVGRLTRISPALFNGIGSAVFAAAAVLAFAAARTGSRRAAALLHLLLTAALGAEGVLFAYQWHVAGAWCVYCLGVLATVGALNGIFSPRASLYGLAAFGASATVFSLLSFVPFHRDLTDGTVAIQEAQGSPELLLIFSEHCPHCRSVVEALRAQRRCTVRYNPVAPLPDTELRGLNRRLKVDLRVNTATARLLGLETIPVLVARRADGLQVISGEGAILAYVDRVCRSAPAEDPILQPWGGGSLHLPSDDGCGLTTECD
ncbi:MAG: hypothetical protein Kow0092_23790 [Deferrisomatales bacterium]